jgi:hypothetical protein
MITIQGSDKSFHATWDCTRQEYKVYKDGKYIITKHCFKDIKAYLK